MELIKKRLKSFVFRVLVAVTGVVLIFLRKETGNAISDALTMCAVVLIPSLFPFMLLSAFALKSGIFEGRSRITAVVMNSVFRLPASAVTAVIFGFIGGYPVGARIIAELYEKGSITHDDARHLFAFCINAGPAFIVSVAGGMLIGSERAGYIIFAAVIISSLLTGFVYSRFRDRYNKTDYLNGVKREDASTALVASVAAASDGIISVCAWVIAFMAFSCAVRYFISDINLLNIYMSVAEVTSGTEYALKSGGVPFAAGCIAFGGGAVMCQLLPSIKKCGIKVFEYLFFRIINGISVYFITALLMKITRLTVPVISQFSAQLHFAPASVALLIMCAVLIFDLASEGKKQLNVFG